MGKKIKIVVDCDNLFSFGDINAFTSQLACSLDFVHDTERKPIPRLVGQHYTADISVEDDSEEKAAAEKPEDFKGMTLYEFSNKIEISRNFSREDCERLYQEYKDERLVCKYEIGNLETLNDILNYVIKDVKQYLIFN